MFDLDKIASSYIAVKNKSNDLKTHYGE